MKIAAIEFGCGCSVRPETQIGQHGTSVVWTMVHCPLHSAAAGLLTTCRQARATIELTKGHQVYVDMKGLRYDLNVEIAKAEGGA